jgi:hypothetical protein
VIAGAPQIGSGLNGDRDGSAGRGHCPTNTLYSVPQLGQTFTPASSRQRGKMDEGTWWGAI